MKSVLPSYGGQAVIEGVMMGGKRTTVTAVRRKDGSVTYYTCDKKLNPSLSVLRKIPIIRGIVAILEASAIGTRHLDYASTVYDEDPTGDETRRQAQLAKQRKTLGTWLGLTAIGILSFLFAKFVFTLIPAVAASLFERWIGGGVAQVLLEGVFKILLLAGYIYFISLTPLMKRLFQYHGAEHKVINTFENGDELTVENVRGASRLHYRCGSSFIVFTAMISIFLYLFFPTHPLWLRLVTRILLIPLDLGLAFEILKLTNRVRHIPMLRWLGYPGLSVQLLTTKEPDDRQIEIGIAAFKKMRARELILEHRGMSRANQVL
ncbi:MAG: DUF1385 domain-containing protein [Sporolactobacillus sp.]|jgi:uncharacterized protein YqhQ|nr:DUF1385 domain-containing protein [Sporolactobacillus sp.]